MSETELAGGFDPDNKYHPPCFDELGEQCKKGPGGEYSTSGHHRLMPNTSEERAHSGGKSKWRRQREDSEFREEGIGDEEEDNMVKSKFTLESEL